MIKRNRAALARRGYFMVFGKVPIAPRRISTIRRTTALRAIVTVLAATAVSAIAGPATSTASAAAACSNESFRESGESANLPDCRAYEQVSPAEKHGYSAVEVNIPAQAAPNGESMVYMSNGAFEGGVSSTLPNAYLAKRSADGWQSTNLAPPTPDPTPPGGDPATYDFSPDLSQWIVTVPLQPLTANATPGVDNLFLTGLGGGYSWVNDVRPPVVPPEHCTVSFLAVCYEFEDIAAFAGATPNYQHVLFESTASLTGGAPEGNGRNPVTGSTGRIENLYESAISGGAWNVSLVGVLPNGTPASTGSSAGSGSNTQYYTANPQVDNRVSHAISEDGSNVVFEADSDEGKPDEAGQSELTEVYDRLNGAETIELSAPAAGATPKSPSAAPARYWGASANGSRVFFTSTAELTTQSYTGPSGPPLDEEGKFEPEGDRGDLYEYDVAARSLRDLTVDDEPADAAEGAGVQGVVGVSEDGSYVYFVAKGELVAGKGVDHEDNLYMVHNGGAPVFIATLSSSDANDWTAVSSALESYLTADGRHVAFSSVNPLRTANMPGGYNNVNPSTGEAEPEIYEYSAPTEAEEAGGGSGVLDCASCDPSGAQPIGPGVIGGPQELNTRHPRNTPFHQARAVSENGGRVFFTSRDPLVAAAAASTQPKVYEYEHDGVGSCEVATGCTYLLSSSSSPAPAVFLDADSEGENVFIATVSRMTASDQDKQYDVYDVRAGGGLVSPSTEAACESSCREAPSESMLGEPLTGFTGPSGNLTQTSQPTSKPKTSSKNGQAAKRKKKLQSALKACRKDRSKRARTRCEVKAQKRYGSKAKSSQSRRGTAARHGKRRGR